MHLACVANSNEGTKPRAVGGGTYIYATKFSTRIAIDMPVRVYLPAGHLLNMGAVASLAFAAAAAAQQPPPQLAPCAGAWSSAPWCAPGPPFEPRAAALVANLTRREKSSLVLMLDNGVPRLGVAPYIWWSEALHGAIAPFQHHGANSHLGRTVESLSALHRHVLKDMYSHSCDSCDSARADEGGCLMTPPPMARRQARHMLAGADRRRQLVQRVAVRGAGRADLHRGPRAAGRARQHVLGAQCQQ